MTVKKGVTMMRFRFGFQNSSVLIEDTSTAANIRKLEVNFVLEGEPSVP